MQQRKALELEYEAEKAAYEQLSSHMGLGRRLKRGDAWYPLQTGKTYFNSLNQPCIEVYRYTDTEIEHNFEYGRPVAFFQALSGEASFLPFQGTVSYAKDRMMVVTLKEMSHATQLERTTALGVQLFFDETSYRQMFAALDHVAQVQKGRVAALRDLIYSKNPATTLSLPPQRFPWLNESQEKAVNEALKAKDLMVVHGPPGTGKTTTLVEAIYETLRREPQVMVCAQSNMAVDWICERLCERGINVLRIGNPSRVTDQMLEHTYERRFEAHPQYPLLWRLRQDIRQLRSQRRLSDQYHQKMERLKERATQLETEIRAQLFDQARVVASTLVGAGLQILSGMKFGTLFIDEAAQALEAACWIAIPHAQRVILAGDHCQLPPTIKSLQAQKAGLGYTLMERIVDNHPECVVLLMMQYRMHERIMQFSSQWFYGGKVESHPSVRHRGILDLEEPIMWINTHIDDCPEEFVGAQYWRINRQEADLTLQTLLDYFNKIGLERVKSERLDVGIISPYRAQVQYLRKMLKSKSAFKPYRSLITINTVDGFQGQERDMILVSLVRSNDKGQIGFLHDLRRMNVAITRARMKLIILGDAETLCHHPFYRALYQAVGKDQA